MDAGTGQLDSDAIDDEARRVRPALLIAGGSAYPAWRRALSCCLRTMSSKCLGGENPPDEVEECQ